MEAEVATSVAKAGMSKGTKVFIGVMVGVIIIGTAVVLVLKSRKQAGANSGSKAADTGGGAGGGNAKKAATDSTSTDNSSTTDSSSSSTPSSTATPSSTTSTTGGGTTSTASTAVSAGRTIDPANLPNGGTGCSTPRLTFDGNYDYVKCGGVWYTQSKPNPLTKSGKIATWKNLGTNKIATTKLNSRYPND